MDKWSDGGELERNGAMEMVGIVGGGEVEPIFLGADFLESRKLTR